MKFKFWLWWFEFKMKRIADEEKINFLCKYLFNYADKTTNLSSLNKEFKYISIACFKNDIINIHTGHKNYDVEIKGVKNVER